MQTALIILFGLVIFGIPAVLLIWGKRAYDRNADRALEAIYAEAERSSRASRNPPVQLVYHTYSGILLYVRQAEHRFSLPYHAAERTLDQLFKYTLKYGFFAYGALIIPVLAYLNYLAQRRAIRRQQAGLRGGRAR